MPQKEYKKLIKYCSAYLNSAAQGELDGDMYMLSGVCADIKAHLKHKRYDLSDIFALCQGFAEQKCVIEERTVMEYFSDRGLEEYELDSLPFMLRLVFLALLCGEQEVSYAVSALHRLENMDFSQINARLSTVEAILSGDPAGVYPRMDMESKIAYRHETARLARKYHITEESAARKIIELCESECTGRRRHVGYYIFEMPLGARRSKLVSVFYAAAIAVFPLFAFVFWKKSAFYTFVLWFILIDIVKQLTDRIILRFAPKRIFPSMDADEPVPDDAKTICVIATLLSDENEVAQLCEKLEDYYLTSGGDENLYFALLGDLPSAKTKNCESDKTILQCGTDEINRLNSRYGEKFIFLTRERVYSHSEGMFIPHERKRGGLMALSSLCLGEESELNVLAGVLCDDIRYCVVLDADTVPLPGSIKRLIAAMRHPLNRPVYDRRRGIVVGGHAILQPRLSVFPQNDLFSSIFAGRGGTDIYGASSSELYESVCSRTSFCGKGIIDLQVYDRVLRKRFPDERILSHDLLEGCYLNAGYFPRAEFLDGFPKSFSSYIKREKRWMRGDWQLLPWLWHSVPTLEERERNPLRFYDKWRSFDNLRRSLLSLFLLTAVFSLLGGIYLPAAAAFICLFIPFLFSEKSSHVQYESCIYSPCESAFLRAFLYLLLLPTFAWSGVSSALMALYRQFISHRKLLEWTTSSQSEKSGYGNMLLFLPQIFAAAFAFVPVFTAPVFLRAFFAFLWLSAIPLILSICRSEDKKPALESDDSAWLKEQADKMIAYFRDNMNAENSYLPPDNIQFKPHNGTAHRTSPTNIGFALVSLLAGADLGLYRLAEILPLLECTVSTLERMDKWHGQLYNWYDTKTALPLSPKTVSTVDSGNLLTCLMVFEKGLREYHADALAERVKALTDSMDIAVMYDGKRNLFRIGYNADRECFFDGHYDMLESEARLCSYTMVAGGTVPVKHWQSLNRRLGGRDKRRGLLSWSGTMFEYLMPSLFIPEYPASLLYESSRYALYCQRAGIDRPFGISESCYFDFDEELNYRYKAHGVQSAAVSSGADDELVLSPYSSYLALMLDPVEAVKSLRAFKGMDMEGKYGLYEAADLTSSRLPKDCEYMPVRCFMAHHIGMSVCAAANTLCGDIMQKRYMSIPRHRAYRYLLTERIPADTHIVPVRRGRKAKVYNDSSDGAFYEAEDYSLAFPHLSLMSNGSFRVMLTDTGLIRIMSGMRDISRFDGQSGGVNFFYTENGELFSLTPAPLYQPSAYSSRFDCSGGMLCMNNARLSSEITACVAPDDTACLFSVRLRSNSDAPARGELIFCLEPVLDRQENYSAHPAFSKLFLSSERDGEGMMLSRRKRGNSAEWYSYVACSADCRMQFSRENAFARQGYYGLRAYRADSSSVPDPICVMRVPVMLEAGESAEFSFAVSCGTTREIAKQAAFSALTLTKSTSSPRLRDIVRLLGLYREEVKSAFDLYSRALFITSARSLHTPVPSQPHGRELLWKFGISGDLPLIFTEFSDDIENLLRRHLFLHLSGAYCDLIILTHDGGSYERPEYRSIMDMLRRIDGESLAGIKGGVHLIDSSALSSSELDALKFLCGAHGDDSQESETIHPLPLPVPNESNAVSIRWGDSSVSFDNMPLRIWSHPLANEKFGWLACDSGCGNMWYLNSRENRINPWYNDPVTPHGPENLYLEGENLFCGEVTFVPGAAIYRSRSGAKVSAFVAKDTPARIIIVEMDNAVPGACLIWHTALQMGESFKDREYVVTHAENGIIYVENPANARYAPYYFAAGSYPSPTRYTCDEHDYLQGSLSMRSGAGYEPCIAMKIPLEKTGSVYRAVIVCGCFDDRAALDKIAKLCANADAELEKVTSHAKELFCDLEISTPDVRFDRFINGFALNQIINGRLLARTSIYQSSGAFGFRDQLQDALSLLSTPPSEARYAIVRRQILRAAARQYEEGDVQHWWHEDKYSTRGVRTRVTDDLLFLPYVTLEYIRISGDNGILNEQIPYLHDDPLRKGENERLNTPAHTVYSENLWEHCRRAMDCVIKRGVGSHGLALLGGGDWNDAMNEAGIKGHGESVWLSWFAAMVAEMMYEFDREKGGEYRDFAEKLRDGTYKAWDGGWFLRGWHDDGTAIGSKSSTVCRIDAISQAFSVLSNSASNKADVLKCRTALKNAYRILPKDGVVRLFDPPFDKKHLNMGYIAAYPPGIRENGGQYTHGAVWLGMALLREGMTDEGADVLSMLLPSERGDEYKAEPFYLASDVYAGENIYGMAGWTIYTGAAGWYYTAVVRDMLGLKFFADRLEFDPRIPAKWNGFSAVLHQNNAQLSINIRRTGRRRIVLDGTECEFVPLPLPECEHRCDVEV